MSVNVTSRNDIEKLMSLLREYTEKLRAICDEYSDVRMRRYQSMVISIVALATGALSFVSYAAKGSIFILNSEFAIPLLLGVIGVTFSLFFTQFAADSRSRFRGAYDAHQVASTVQRLIQTASQYNEHSSQKISDKFEFELRLSEADAALRIYEDLFGRVTKK